MINFKRYLLASLTGLAFASFLPLSFSFLYASSINMLNGFVQSNDEKGIVTLVDAFAHLFGQMPHLWLLAIIPAVIGFRFGLRLSNVGFTAPASTKNKRRRRR